MSYSTRYRHAIKGLARPLTSEDGMPEAEITAGEKRLGIRLPSALRAYYLLAGRFDQLNCAHNRLLSPREWFADAGKLVFMAENQEVVFWGIPTSATPDDDPPVLQGVNVPDDPIGWYPEHGRCSEFLLLMLHWQACCGGMPFTSAADITSVALGRIHAEWPLIGEMGEMVVFARPGCAMCVIGEGETRELFAGGRTEHDFNLIRADLARIDVKLDRA